MNKEKLIHELQQSGLREKEARVYLSMLNLGTAKMTDIAKHAQLKRPTTYLIIDELLKKNLINKIRKGKIDFYTPLNPDQILHEQINKVQNIKKILPTLKQTKPVNAKSLVTYYEGKEQVEKIHDIIFRSKELFSLAYLDEYWKVFDEQHNRHIYELLKRHGGIIHLLVPQTKKNFEIISHKYRKGLQDIRFLPSNFSNPNKVGVVYNSQMVVFVSYSTMTATAIEDPNILAYQKQIWQMLWQQSEPRGV